MTTDIVLDISLMDSVRNGSKKFTVRNGRRDYQLGPGRFLIEDDDGNIINILLIDIFEIAYTSMYMIEYKYPGYMESIKKYYPDINDYSEVTVVKFTYLDG